MVDVFAHPMVLLNQRLYGLHTCMSSYLWIYAAVQVVLSKQIPELGCIHPQAYNIGTFCLNVTEAIMNHPLRRGDYC